MRRHGAILAMLLCAGALPTLAQSQVAVERGAAGCGPEQQFDVKLDGTVHSAAQPEAGKGLIYVFEDVFAGQTLRIGADGSWVGATKPKSYVYFSLAPGEHHVCTDWQTSVISKPAQRVGGAITVNVEAGKTYFLRTVSDAASGRVLLETIDDADGHFLISCSFLSSAKAKK
jgi:hypothetical protein